MGIGLAFLKRVRVVPPFRELTIFVGLFMPLAFPLFSQNLNLPMAKAPSDTRLEHYAHERHQFTALELASRYKISVARVYGDLSTLKLELPYDKIDARLAFYKANHRDKDFTQIADAIGISASQALYELKLAKLSVRFPRIEDDQGNPSRWKLKVDYEGEQYTRRDLLIELAYFGYPLEDIVRLLNQNSPVLHPDHLIPQMIEKQLNQLNIPERQVATQKLKSFIPIQASRSERENLAIRKISDFIKTEKRTPQKRDFYPELEVLDPESAKQKAQLRFSEFVACFGNATRALLETKKRLKDADFRLLDWDWTTDPGDEGRKLLQQEVLESLRAQLNKDILELPSRSHLMEWLGVTWENLVSEEEYATGKEKYFLRIFDSQRDFEDKLRKHFPKLKSFAQSASIPPLED